MRASPSCRWRAAARCPQLRWPASPTTCSSLNARGPGVLLRRPVNATGAPTGTAATASTAIDWSSLRGGFLVDGTLYYGLTDGSFYRRTFDPSTSAVGPQQAVNLYDDPDNGQRMPFAIANLTGTFFDTDTHRIYYTVANDARLFYRYFTPESRVVGAQTFVADAGGVSSAPSQA